VPKNWILKTTHAAAGFLLLSFVCLRASDISLYSVLPVAPPIIGNNRMTYTVDIVMSRCPADCWCFWDASKSRMTLEFYDTYIVVPDILTVKGTSPVIKIETDNSWTTAVISGKRSQIHLCLKEEMHGITECRGDTLRVSIWKELSPSDVVNQKKKVSFSVPIITWFISTIMTVTLLAYIL
jgi:hypothetical protein